SAPISDGYPQNQPEKNIQENFTRCFDPEVDWDLNYLETTCFSEDSVGRKIPIDVQYPTFTVTHSAMEGSFEKSKIQRIRNTNNRRCKIRKPSLTLANSKKFIFLLKSVALLLILGGLVIFWVSRHTPQNYSGEYKELMSSEIGDWSEISERPSTKALYSHNRHEKPNDNGHRQSSQPDTPALSANTRDNGIRAMERVAGLPTVKGATPEENRSGSNQKGGIPQGDLESSGPFPGINSIPELIPQNDFSDLLSPGVDEPQDRMSPLDENGRQPEIPNAPSSENSPSSLPEMKSTVANSLLADSGNTADSGVNNRATNNISPNNESNGTSRAEMNPSPVITSLFQALTPDIDTDIVYEASQFAGSNPEINTPAVSDSGAENNTVTEDDSNTTPASSAPVPILVANVLTPKINQDQSSVETVPVPGTPVASHYNVLLPAVGTNDIPESVKNGQAPSSVPEQSPVAELTGTPEIPENRDTPLFGSIQNNPNVPADSPAVAPAIQTTATETEELEPITDMPLSSLQHPAEQEPAANELVPNQFPTTQISHPKLQDSPSDQFRQNEENQPSESLLTNHPVTFNAPLANPENDLSIKPLEEIQQMAE
ncbi:MAG: hypothetical protein IKW74_08350, partial [Thermoguttaceae bacterium]|nr:hypothetical protein [Thermoguttaceae bacterium]